MLKNYEVVQHHRIHGGKAVILGSVAEATVVIAKIIGEPEQISLRRQSSHQAPKNQVKSALILHQLSTCKEIRTEHSSWLATASFANLTYLYAV